MDHHGVTFPLNVQYSIPEKQESTDPPGRFGHSQGMPRGRKEDGRTVVAEHCLGGCDRTA